MGELADSRIVLLRGSIVNSQFFSPNVISTDAWIKSALELAGFYVVGVRTQNAATFGYAQNIEIELRVLNQYTAEQARVNAITVLEAYMYAYKKVFYNTTLSVVYDQNTASQTSGSQTGTPAARPGSNAAPPSGYDYNNQTGSGIGSDVLNNFARGVGIGTPTLLLAGGLVAILLLKR